MGIYGEYLDRNLSFPDLTAARKEQLRRISALRGGRDVLVYAADLNKGRVNAPISIEYADLLPISDQLSNLHGKALDLILETPGGAGEIAEDIVRLLRGRFDDIGVIIPGCAKSAGTVMAMAADEILMEPVSALGPIDAQLSWQGKVFSADALIEGMEKIKDEVAKTGVLNKAYIPMLQGISPGELQSAENALEFARILVTDWLRRYKFKNWTHHSSSGEPVTDKDRESRAKEIAKTLCNHRRWKTHGRSINLSDLEQMRLKITDYSKLPDLADAIRRYYTLLQMSFSSTNIYKVFETPESQIVRFQTPHVPPPQAAAPSDANILNIDVTCGKCGKVSRVQANLGSSQPLQPGSLPFPGDNKFMCPGCGAVADISDARRQIEAQSKKPVVS
jgi:Serine dehydrogenase proteinase